MCKDMCKSERKHEARKVKSMSMKKIGKRRQRRMMSKNSGDLFWGKLPTMVSAKALVER